MGSSEYSTTLEELERDVQVPLESMVSEVPKAPAPMPISEQDFDLVRLLGVTGAGYL